MLWGSVSSRDDPGVGLCIRGLGTRHCTCDLGTGLYIEVRSMGVRIKLAGVSHQVKKSLAPLTQIDLLTYIYRQKKKKKAHVYLERKLALLVWHSLLWMTKQPLVSELLGQK